MRNMKAVLYAANLLVSLGLCGFILRCEAQTGPSPSWSAPDGGLSRVSDNSAAPVDGLRGPVGNPYIAQPDGGLRPAVGASNPAFGAQPAQTPDSMPVNGGAMNGTPLGSAGGAPMNSGAAPFSGVKSGKSKGGSFSGVGMAGKAVKTNLGLTDRAAKTTLGMPAKALKETFKTIF